MKKMKIRKSLTSTGSGSVFFKFGFSAATISIVAPPYEKNLCYINYFEKFSYR